MTRRSIYVEVCHCGHDIATHFDEKHACLGMHCDCPKYVHRDDPDTRKQVLSYAPPAHPDRDRDTDPIITPVVHPLWCTCATCYPGGWP